MENGRRAQGTGREEEQGSGHRREVAGCEGWGRDEEWCWDWVTGEGGCRACGMQGPDSGWVVGQV